MKCRLLISHQINSFIISGHTSIQFFAIDRIWQEQSAKLGPGNKTTNGNLGQRPPGRDEDGPSWSREMWDQLPELILTQIFGHLDRADRASVSQVCRSWNRTLSSPVLWRTVTVLIDRDLRGDFPLAGELAVREFPLRWDFSRWI